jgi:prepilin-type processing-associated H-X9-DG protein
MAFCFTIVHGPDGSYQNNAPIDTQYPQKTVTDADYVYPAETRIMRDEMFSFFDAKSDPGGAKYYYTPDFYEAWHQNGGGMVFADGHAKFIASELAFQKSRATPDGKNFIDDGCWYYCE